MAREQDMTGRGARARRNQRRALVQNVEYGVLPPEPPLARPCSSTFNGCGYSCHCGVSWDTGEERPECPRGDEC